MKKIAVLGAGNLGCYITNHFLLLQNKNYEISLFAKEDLDITDEKQYYQLDKYDIIINCAAYTKVDLANTDIVESYKCSTVNNYGVYLLAKYCKNNNKKLIHISTDFVYGSNDNVELTETTKCTPVNVYGSSKLDGEQYLTKTHDNYLILRVSWTFGVGTDNFIKKIVKQLQSSSIKKIFVVDDQVGRPTSFNLIFNTIYAYINDLIPNGIYNLQNSGEYISKYELAKFIENELNYIKRIKPIKTNNKSLIAAPRQLNSRLNCDKLDKLNIITRLHWKNEVREYLNILTYNGKETFLQKIIKLYKRMVKK